MLLPYDGEKSFLRRRRFLKEKEKRHFFKGGQDREKTRVLLTAFLERTRRKGVRRGKTKTAMEI